MPRNIRLHHSYGQPVPVATQAELLEFANKLRVAGDADPLGALLPSNPGDSETCLIANACNFSSRVIPVGDEDSNGETDWFLVFPTNMSLARRRKVASAVNIKLKDKVVDFDEDEHNHVLPLPRHIGNAAQAFDMGVAFKRYMMRR